MCVALEQDLRISMTKGACCLVLIAASDQPTLGRTELLPATEGCAGGGSGEHLLSLISWSSTCAVTAACLIR